MPQKELITMTKKESKRLNIINSLINGIIDGTEASKQMGVSKYKASKKIKAKSN